MPKIKSFRRSPSEFLTSPDKRKEKTKRIIIVAIAVFVLAITILFAFPFLSGEKMFKKEMQLDKEKALIISDLHLDSNPRELNCIGNYIEENEISYLIINGDLFDKKHSQRFTPKIFNQAYKELGLKQTSLEKIIYLLASHYHDPKISKKEVQEFTKDKKKVLVFKGLLELKTQKEKINISHGDYLLTAITTGGASIISKLSPNMMYEKFFKSMLEIEEDEWLIIGHTHVAGIDYESKVANTGSWVNRVFPASDTGILIKNNPNSQNVSLITIPCCECN